MSDFDNILKDVGSRFLRAYKIGYLSFSHFSKTFNLITKVSRLFKNQFHFGTTTKIHKYNDSQSFQVSYQRTRENISENELTEKT